MSSEAFPWQSCLNTMSRVFATLALGTLAAVSASFLGVDVSQPVSAKAAVCMQKGGVSYGVVRAWHSIDTFDTAAPGTLAAWAAAGIQGDVYLFPCSFVDPVAQVKGMLGNLTAVGARFGRVWLDIESNADPACAWRSDKKANCAWLQTLVAAVNATGVPLGIYTSIHEYELLMSDTAEGCQLCTGKLCPPLWYPHYETPPQPNFSDFSPFGGWTAPTVKQFDDKAGAPPLPPDCGVGVDANWAPVMPPRA